MRRLVPAALATALTAAVCLGALPGHSPARAAERAPAKCADGDITLDDRVYPEPRLAESFVTFERFECSVRYLESKFPTVIQVTTVGESAAGHPIYDVLMTDETVTTPKEKLLIVNSIHGNEPGGREGAFRVMEDFADPRFHADDDWVQQALDQYVVHFLFPNPDGWVSGDLTGQSAELTMTRGNSHGTDLNRNFPVQGYINVANKTLEEPESNATVRSLFSQKGWFLGTDNHGQGPDEYAAAGLQIVGEFDYQKSETLAVFADAISEAFAETNVPGALEALHDATGLDMGAYHWGTLYDMLGYSASGSMIDYYNTKTGLGGTGYATELTAGSGVNWIGWPRELAQVWVDCIRAINYSLLKQSVTKQKHTFPLGGSTAYVHDPEVLRHDDANGPGSTPEATEGSFPQLPYAATRMQFFVDLGKHSARPVTKLTAAEIVADGRTLDRFDSIVLTERAVPDKVDEERYFANLKAWVERGGNLVVTDGAVSALTSMGVLANDEGVIRRDTRYVGSVEFTTRDHPLTANLRGVARQTYDSVPIGYAFPPAGENCPNWSVDRAVWEAAGGTTVGILAASGLGTTGDTTRTTYGELPLGEGKVRFIGALLPQPTEAYYHPFGLQNYAVTYTGYTLLANSLAYDAPNLGAAGAAPAPAAPPAPAPAPRPAPGRGPLAATGGSALTAVGALLLLCTAAAVRRRTGPIG